VATKAHPSAASATTTTDVDALRARIAELEAAATANDAELAVINDVQRGLAERLDLSDIYQLVGDRIRSIFTARTIYIAVYDAATGMLSFPYDLMEGVPVHTEPFAIGPGLTSIVIQTGQPLLLRSFEEARDLGAIDDGLIAESWLGIPILSGDRVLGSINDESEERGKKLDADERLL
jgi:transcriptional regulator with GAF, ATPase, and Fis domain